ncbi:MAG: hypothetical protein AB7V08_05200 [Elusimicrobiales bacterium]
MKAPRFLIALTLLALAGTSAFAQEAVEWKHPDFLPEFALFTESVAYTRETWTALPPLEQARVLEAARKPAAERLAAMTEYYETAMRPWNTEQLNGYAAGVKEADAAAVKLWLGQAKADGFKKKLSVTRAMIKKAAADRLTEEDRHALRPYLTPEAIADLGALRAAASLQRQAAVTANPKKNEIPKGTVNAALQGFTGQPGGSVSGNLAKAFDGYTASGGVLPLPETAARQTAPGAPGAAVSGSAGQTGARADKSAGAALAQRGPVSANVKSSVPAPLPGTPEQKRSTAWTSDAYGITVQVAGRPEPLSFRKARDAEAAIRQLPDGSISRITLYGHGSPGMQTVGDDAYDPDSAAAMLRGKMARGGVVQFSGCNTASIGGASVNPAVGISMAARRLLYFSLPYFQDRMDGVPAAQARQQWEKTWNADLSRDTSLQMRGTVVCGYRTFGLVPGRLPGLTRLLGNQEATTPGYVAGKKVCYQDGREVPEP